MSNPFNHIVFGIITAFAGLIPSQKYLYPAYPANYSCANPHCYAYVGYYAPNWTSAGFFQGVSTLIATVPLVCKGCGNSNQGQTGFIDNETWLVDFDSYTCANNAERACWVEAGYGTFYDYDTNTSPNIYFWADSRPLYLGYTEHPLYPVSSSDKNVIINIYTGSNYNWYVNMYPSYSQYYQEQSTDNEMVPAHIELGQELQGTSGASAPTASFQFNGYYIGPADKLAFDYFTRGQDYSEISRPPYGRWVAVPDSQNSGGEWITSCC